MTLRDEIEALENKAIQSHIVHPQTAYRQAILDVLAIFDRYVVKAIERYQREATSEERPAREAGWLVERLWNNNLYYFSARKAFGINGVTLNDRNYSQDANDAIRFSREEDAMVALNYLCGNEGRVVDHCWIDANTAAIREARNG